MDKEERGKKRQGKGHDNDVASDKWQVVGGASVGYEIEYITGVWAWVGLSPLTRAEPDYRVG